MKSEFITDNFNEHIFITADPQFGSRGLFGNVQERMKFKSMKALHAALVENWNAAVNSDNLILCLGDCNYSAFQ